MRFSYNFFLKKNFPSIHLLNRLKIRLNGIGKVKKNNLETINKRLAFYSSKVFKTQWLHTNAKNMAIKYLNNYIEKTTLELEKLNLSQNEKELLKETFNKYKIL